MAFECVLSVISWFTCIHSVNIEASADKQLNAPYLDEAQNPKLRSTFFLKNRVSQTDVARDGKLKWDNSFYFMCVNNTLYKAPWV